MSDDDTLFHYQFRSSTIYRTIYKQKDIDLQRQIAKAANQLSIKFSSKDRKKYMISDPAWEYVKSNNWHPYQVFAHPEILKTVPQSSLYYRGISALSQKAVSRLIGVQVKPWEDGKKQNIKFERFEKAASVYNVVISNVLLDVPDWNLETGYRAIVATMGISLDGSMRNLIGARAQESVSSLVKEFVFLNKWADGTGAKDSLIISKNDQQLIIKFGSEPDIECSEILESGKHVIATVEIKGGTDPAGSLERLGAMMKSFEETAANCTNFLISGVITNEVERRLKELSVNFYRLQDFSKLSIRTDFLNELFHHTLRLTDRSIVNSDVQKIDWDEL